MKSTSLSFISRSLALAAGLGLTLASQARAAGLIMVDPGFAPVPRPIGVVRPGINIVRPGPNPTPRPPHSTTPVLRGGVSFGLRLQSQDIKVEISDQVARTYIVQTFVNDGDQNVAGTYLFPLPEDTTFSSFSLHIDGKPIEGKILEAKEARATYEEIVRKMIDPGLLEYADYKTVRARIFPIPAHGTKKVELEYTQLLKADNGLIKYRFPLKGDADAQGDVEDTKVAVKLSGKQGLRTIWSPSHTVDIKREENNRAKVAFTGSGGIGTDKDFMLYYSVSDKEMQANLLTHKIASEDGYFMLTLAPPLKNATVQSKDIVLVADTSGSMQGDKIAQTKKALKYVVNALGANDRFGIVQFNTDADSFKSGLVVASPENKKAAEDYIDDLEPRGGTNISDALNSGVSLLNSSDTRPAYLVLMTDGEPTVGETSVANLLKSVKSKRDLRLFDFGVGYDVNTRFLSRLAEEHHGTSQFLELGENLENALAAFYNKIKSPVLSDCQIKYDGITVKDVYPRAVKDIFAGTQVLLLGRYKAGGKSNVTVTGNVNGQPKSYVFPVDFAQAEASHGYLPRLWAMRRIGHLSEVAQENGDNREVVDEIVALSQKYGIISAYTSFLVTDPSEDHRLANGGVRPMPMGRPMPMPMQMNMHQLRSRAGGGGAPAAALGFAMPVSANAAFADKSSMMLASTGGARFNHEPNRFGARREVRIADDGPVVGKKAVEKAKSLALLKEGFDSAKDEESRSLKGEMKQAEGKTFYLSADGQTWVDSQYKGEKTEDIAFASTRYFELAKSSPKMASYLAVGRQVIFIVDNHAYKVTLK
ncbi:MAG: VWA domain-containing protein [Cyanobacteria bacterium SZAS LIN-3]|nr:VWA domain-containing protein [Cyanobacteria bacterium SZAS LIN-3]